jgi:hypothetical protein
MGVDSRTDEAGRFNYRFLAFPGLLPFFFFLKELSRDFVCFSMEDSFTSGRFRELEVKNI